MRVTPFLPLLAVLLAGCVGVDPAQERERDEAACRSYGFKPRTNAFAECLQRIDLNRDADRRARLYGANIDRPGAALGVGPYGRVW